MSKWGWGLATLVALTMVGVMSSLPVMMMAAIGCVTTVFFCIALETDRPAPKRRKSRSNSA